jgi:hypothetical protein
MPKKEINYCPQNKTKRKRKEKRKKLKLTNTELNVNKGHCNIKSSDQMQISIWFCGNGIFCEKWLPLHV